MRKVLIAVVAIFLVIFAINAISGCFSGNLGSQKVCETSDADDNDITEFA